MSEAEPVNTESDSHDDKNDSFTPSSPLSEGQSSLLNSSVDQDKISGTVAEIFGNDDENNDNENDGNFEDSQQTDETRKKKNIIDSDEESENGEEEELTKNVEAEEEKSKQIEDHDEDEVEREAFEDPNDSKDNNEDDKSNENLEEQDKKEDELSAIDSEKDSTDKDQSANDKDKSIEEEDFDSDIERPAKKRVITESDDEDKVEKNKDRSILSDSEDESPTKKVRSRAILSDSEDDNDEDKTKKRKLISDSENEDKEDDEEKATKKKKSSQKGSDEEDDDELKDDTKEGEEDKEKDKEQEEDKEAVEGNEAAVPDISSDESDEDEGKRRKNIPEDFVYDFDLMMAKKKEESYRRRKRKNIDIINDNDDIIAELIGQMKQAADEDFELNKNRKAATCKLKLLPVVETQLRKIDLREAFLDAGVLGVITDWLTPLPDRSLPNLQVRETMLKLLGEFNIMDVERLKASGIGKAVMYLFKHPKETKDNKRRVGALISSWSRPIFSLDSDFHTMSKEEREQRDFDHMTKITETRRVRADPKTPPSSSRGKQSEPEKTLRPGDKGWVPRARVPAPSTRDYVIRPKSNVDAEMTRSGSKKAITRLDKHLRNFREKKKLMKTQRAVPISIEGRRMSL